MAEFKDVTVQRWVCGEPDCEDYFDKEITAQIHEANHEAERCKHPHPAFAINDTAAVCSLFQECPACGREGLTGFRILVGGVPRYEAARQVILKTLWEEATET